MLRPQIAVAALAKKSVLEKIQFGEDIVQALADHATVFPTPSPTVVVLEAVTKELHDANTEALSGLHTGRARLNRALGAFDDAIGLYQTYVNLVAQGNGLTIEQSGLTASKPAQKAGPMPAPDKLMFVGSIPKQLTATVEKVPHAKAYVWEYFVGDAAPVAAADWRLASGTPTGKLVMTGLASKTTVWLRCAAVGAKGQGPWSAPISDNVR